MKQIFFTDRQDLEWPQNCSDYDLTSQELMLPHSFDVIFQDIRDQLQLISANL